jgi:Protein of unknown function (DUF5661)
MVAHSIRKSFTSAQAAAVAEMLGVELARQGIELEAFRLGMEVELEHGSRDPRTNVTDDDPILTGKIALAHLRELPDYYERLEEMERRAEHRVTDGDPQTSHLWLRFEHQSCA